MDSKEAVMALYFPRIPKPALCMNFKDPAIGAIVDMAGMIQPC